MLHNFFVLFCIGFFVLLNQFKQWPRSWCRKRTSVIPCHSCNSDVFSCVSVKCEHPFPKSRTYWWNQNHYLEVIHCLLCYFFHLQLDLNLNCGFWLWLLSHPWFMLTNVFIIDVVPKRRRPARSIFDGFRDFQTETSKCLYIYLTCQFPLLTFEHTQKKISPLHFFFLLVASFFYWLLNTVFLVRQEQELRNGGTVDKKLSTLADLFRPPIELMHKGSFETVTSHSLDT